MRAWSEASEGLEPRDLVRYLYEEVWDPDIDHRAAEGAVDDVGPIRGRDAMRRYYEDWLETFDAFEARVEEIVDVGDGRVVTMTHIRGSVRGGPAVDMRYATLYTVRGRRVVRGRDYWTRDEALAAAGDEAS